MTNKIPQSSYTVAAGSQYQLSISITALINHLISCCEQIVGHLVQVGSLVCVNKTHHLLEHFGLHIVDLHTVLREKKQG